jgi:hypothetical protein
LYGERQKNGWELKPRNGFLFIPIPLEVPTEEQVKAFFGPSHAELYEEKHFMELVSLHHGKLLESL